MKCLLVWGLVSLFLWTLPVHAFAQPRLVGLASWHGPWHHGRLTATGEVFSRFKLTAAHRTLPLGTLVRVVNLRNGKDVVVQINDRGPYLGRRLIDLSEAAARQLDMIRNGLEWVQLIIL